jgi:hypothetical protein
VRGCRYESGALGMRPGNKEKLSTAGTGDQNDERPPECKVQKIIWKGCISDVLLGPPDTIGIDECESLHDFAKKIDTGSQGDSVTRDSGRNGRGNGITLCLCRSKFVRSMDQFFE